MPSVYILEFWAINSVGLGLALAVYITLIKAELPFIMNFHIMESLLIIQERGLRAINRIRMNSLPLATVPDNTGKTKEKR